MIIVLIVVGLLLGIGGAYISANSDLYGFWETAGKLFGTFGWVCAIISAIVAILLAVEVKGLSVVDDKIAMYQEENNTIETQMDELVAQYMNYESDTLAEFKNENSITLVSLYPELKSDTLVQQQLDVYVANNNQIKALKLQKVSGSVSKWWLYFGG